MPPSPGGSQLRSLRSRLLPPDPPGCYPPDPLLASASVRRGTFVMIVVLFILLLAAGIAQLLIASRDRGPLRGPTSPGQIPSQTTP